MRYKDLMENNSYLFSNYNAAIKIIKDLSIISNWMDAKKSELHEDGLPEQWGDIGVVFNDPYFIVIRDLVEFPSGKLGTYSRLVNQADIKGGQGVVIMPEFREKILLLYNFRHATRSWHYEFPRGFGEPGQSAKCQAHDEISEETGGTIESLIDLGNYHNNTGMEGNLIQLYYAKLSSIGEPDKASGIESFRWVSINELEDLIRDEIITDGFTIGAYARAKLQGVV